VQTSRIAPVELGSIKVLFTGSPVDIEGKQGKAEAVYFVSNAAGIRAGKIQAVQPQSIEVFSRELIECGRLVII
jgi:hypothetical protein